MEYTSLRIIISCLIALVWFSSAAQEPQSDELAAWQFAGEVSLDESFRDDPDLKTLFAADKFLIASPTLHADGCGSVTVNEIQADGSIVELQLLQTANFGAECSDNDGFGYSMDFTNNILVVGAPGQINFTAGTPIQLTAGAVYIYRFDEVTNQYTPLQALQGDSQNGNLSWGTRVKTDGDNILVQGNESATPVSAQGNANPRTVNLIMNTATGWRKVREITDNTATMFGQDFSIEAQSIFINQHIFKEDIIRLTGLNRAPELQASLYDVTVLKYGLDSALFSNVPERVIRLDVDFRSQFIAPAIDQLYFQSSESTDNILIYCGNYFEIVIGPVGFDERICKYRLNEVEPIDLVGIYQINGTGNTALDTENIFVGNKLVAISSFNVSEQSIIETIGFVDDFTTDDGENVRASAEVVQRELTYDSNNNGFANPTGLQVNADQTLIALQRLQDDTEQVQHRITLHKAAPTLDPAISQTWWFGEAFSGQGLAIEVLAGNKLQLYWLTFDFDGNQMWLRGVGALQNNEVEMTMMRARGPQFDAGLFDSGDRIREEWGIVTVQFDSCMAGSLSYDSSEFGSGDLPIMPLIDLELECGTGVIRKQSDRPAVNDDRRFTELSFTGSYFDPSRNGEGLILMPFDNNCASVQGPFSFGCRLAYLLTYDSMGNQSWISLGVLADTADDGQFVECLINRQEDCIIPFVPIRQPRRPMGGVFGSDFDPDQVMRIPWGVSSSFYQPTILDQPRSINFSNPDGQVTLVLRQLTSPVGYRFQR